MRVPQVKHDTWLQEWDAVDQWHQRQAAMHALTEPPQVVLCLDRFRRAQEEVRKDTTPIRVTPTILLPVFVSPQPQTLTCQHCEHSVAAVIMHHGKRPAEGHYTTRLLVLAEEDRAYAAS